MFDEETCCYSFDINTPGTYTVTITVDGVETEITVEVALLPPQSFVSEVYNPFYTVFEEKAEVTAYVGKEVFIRASAGQYYNSEYIAEIVQNAENATISVDEIEEMAATSFVASEVGTYTVKLTSTISPEVSCTLTINVVEAPNVAEMLTGYYIGKNDNGEVLLAAKFVDNTIEIEYMEMKAVVSFTYVDEELSFEYVSGDDMLWDFYITETYELAMQINGYDFILEEAEEPKPIDPSLEALTGVIVVTDKIGGGQTNNSGTFRYEIGEDNAIIIYVDGVVSDSVFIQPALGGGYLFQCPGLLNPAKMEKVEG